MLQHFDSRVLATEAHAADAGGRALPRDLLLKKLLKEKDPSRKDVVTQPLGLSCYFATVVNSHLQGIS